MCASDRTMMLCYGDSCTHLTVNIKILPNKQFMLLYLYLLLDFYSHRLLLTFV